MKQHRFDKNFQMIIEAVQEVYNETHHDISDEELEEYYSSFSEAEVDKVVSDALKEIQESGAIFESEEDLEEGVMDVIKKGYKAAKKAVKKISKGAGKIAGAFSAGYHGEKGGGSSSSDKKDKKKKDDTKPKPTASAPSSDKPKKTSIGSKIKHGVKAFKTGAKKAVKHGVKAGVKAGKQSYKSQQSKEKTKINKKPKPTK